MVKDFAHKRAARAYQAAHPGITLPEAMRAVSNETAPPPPPPKKRTPWMRTLGPHNKVSCYFCGEREAILSSTDYAADAGRIAVYCDSPDCEARTVEAIVLRDGDPATIRRADVRILADIPAASYHQPPADPEEYDWMVGTSPAARRAQPAGLLCLFCGERSCVLSYGDVPADTGRMQLYCENSECSAREVEVLVERDGSVETSERPDVKALRELDTPPQLRGGDGIRIRRYGEARDAYLNDNRLERRLERRLGQ